MASGTSRGKQSFREFTRTANQLKRLTERAIKSGEQYTIEDIEGWYDDIIQTYTEDMQAQDIPNMELWLSRAEDKKSDDVAYFVNAYPVLVTPELEPDTDDNQTGIEVSEHENEPDTIYGIPVISEGECIDNGNSARGQILLTLEELIEYLEPIPPSVINGLIPVYDENGNLQGYRLCGAKNT